VPTSKGEPHASGQVRAKFPQKKMVENVGYIKRGKTRIPWGGRKTLKVTTSPANNGGRGKWEHRQPGVRGREDGSKIIQRSLECRSARK